MKSWGVKVMAFDSALNFLPESSSKDSGKRISLLSLARHCCGGSHRWMTVTKMTHYFNVKFKALQFKKSGLCKLLNLQNIDA